MFRIIIILFIIFSISALSEGDEYRPFQSQASFEAALRNTSTAPSYVLITVVDDRSGVERTGCTIANFLQGAIQLESGLDYDKVNRMILENKTHVFHFLKPKAIENVLFLYSQSDIQAVRKQLIPLSISQLRDGFSGSGKLHALYQDKPGNLHAAYRDAVACVLIERGLSPGAGDITDQLWVAP